MVKNKPKLPRYVLCVTLMLLWRVPDKRTDPWPLVYSPVPVSLIFLLYLCAVWHGPRLMKHRPPVDLRVVLIVYNSAMVALSVYIFYEVCWSGLMFTTLTFTFLCISFCYFLYFLCHGFVGVTK